MIAVLIFAGRSKRFWPLSEKNLFPVCGTTLLEEQVRRLKAGGVEEIFLVAGEHNKTEARRLMPGLRVIEQEDLDLGMRGALLSALPKCGKGPVMVVSANDVIEPQAYRDLLKKSMRMKGGLILARKVSSYFPGGYLSVKGSRITGIVEKPVPGTEPSDLINIVAHVHASAPLLLKALRSVRPTRDDGYENALSQLLFGKHIYEAVPYKGLWQPVKYPWHLLSLLQILLPSKGRPMIHRSAAIHKTAVIEGPVVLGKNVRVFAHATVMGPCTIGDGTIIANNVLVRGSSIGRNCVIGYNTEVARSILGNDVWTHSSYIGDSVFGNNISLGAGTITGNLRLDEEEITSLVGGKPAPTELRKLGAIVGDGCRTGIHTCMAPGTKIGMGSFINSMTLVTADIPDMSFVKAKKTGLLDIRSNIKRPHSAVERAGFKKKLG